MEVVLQGTLLGASEPAIDESFAATRRVLLSEGAWIEHVPAWLAGAEDLFVSVADLVEWNSPMVTMWDKRLPQPRLNGSVPHEGRPPIVEAMRRALSDRYEIEFRAIGANWYRDGRDSVAWHGDRVARTLPEATIAIVSLGGPRRFLLRPKGGGSSVKLELGSGDLLAMGGSCQRTWQHSVPKVTRAAPRISLTFRHLYDD